MEYPFFSATIKKNRCNKMKRRNKKNPHIQWNLRILSLSVRVSYIGLLIFGRQEWNAVPFPSEYNS